MNIGQKIRELRKKKNLTQKAVADHLKVDSSQISKYESGENIPPMDKIQKLAELLETKVSEIADPETLVKLNTDSKPYDQGTGLEKLPNYIQEKLNLDYIKKIEMKNIELMEENSRLLSELKDLLKEQGKKDQEALDAVIKLLNGFEERFKRTG